MKRICSIEGCERKHFGRGWCEMHYDRWYKHGDPLVTRQFPRSGSRAAWFWSKVNKTETCWLWTPKDNGQGYGVFAVDGKTRLAHRYAYELSVGPIPDGLTLDHLCRNRACVRPDHLEPVTQRENVLRSPIAQAAIHAAKTHCSNGHPYDAANTSWAGPDGRWRACRACARQRSASRRAVKERAR